MSTMTTTQAPSAWLPEGKGALIIQPLATESVALRALGGLSAVAKAGTNSYRVPTVTADPTVAWVEEGEEIDESQLVQGEEHDTFHKVAGLSVITKELANDSDPKVAEQVGLGLARSIAKEIDAAFFGGRGATDTKPPRGLKDITGTSAVSTTEWEDLDPFNAALMTAAGLGVTLGAWVAHPNDALALTQLRKAGGSNEPLLQPDPTQAAQYMISGVPLLVTSAVEEGTVWGIPTADRVQLIVREDVAVETDSSVYFTSDKVVVKATARLTTLFPHPAAIAKIIITGP